MRVLRPLLGWDGLLAVLTVLALAYATLAVPNFATTFNISQAIAGVSEKALLVLPMALLMIVREIDLSVASILALSSVVLGALVQAEVPLALAMAAALAVGGLAGLVNGLLVTRLGLSSLVVTLGTMALFRGIGYVILGSASVNVLPDALTDFGINTVLADRLPGDLGNLVPWTIVPFLVLAPIFAVVLHLTPTGRRLYAVGGNPETARYSGIDGRRLRLALFAVSGLVSAVAGIVFTARLSNARADNAVGFELDVITVALLGGINVFGGRGNLAGVFWALALVALLRNGLGLSQVGGDAQGIVIGSLLILSLLLSNAVQGFVTSAQWRRTVRAQREQAAPTR